MCVLRTPLRTLLLALLAGLATYVAAWLALRWLVPKSADRFLGPIQLATWLCFFAAEALLLRRQLQLVAERDAFRLGLLPSPEQGDIYPETAIALRRRVLDLPAVRRNLLFVRLVDACLRRSRTEWSQAGTGMALQDATGCAAREFQANDAPVRYLAWAIPMLGFVGTVFGIGRAIGALRYFDAADLMARASTHLATAFDTTLLSLVLSVLVMLHWQVLQTQEDRLLTAAQRTCHDDLVCRMCQPTGPHFLT